MESGLWEVLGSTVDPFPPKKIAFVNEFRSTNAICLVVSLFRYIFLTLYIS